MQLSNKKTKNLFDKLEKKNKKKLLINSVYYNFFFRIILKCKVLRIKTFND